MQAPSPVHVRQEIVEELQIALAIEDHHWQTMEVDWSANHPCQVLRDDVLEERGLARAGHTQHDALHDTHLVGPVPRLAVNVVSQNNGVLFPGICRKLFVPGTGYDQRRVGPLSLSTGTGPNNKDRRPNDCQPKKGRVAGQFGNLLVFEIKPLTSYIPGEPAHRHQDESNYNFHALQNWRTLLSIVVRVAHHYLHVLVRLSNHLNDRQS